MNFETLIPALGANLIWQTFLLAAAVGIALHILPEHAAKARYHIALITFMGSMLLCAAPFLPDVTPQLSVGVSPQSTSGISTPIVTQAPTPSPETAVSITMHEQVFPLGKTVIALWLFGTFLALLKLCRAAYVAHSLARKATPIVLSNPESLSKHIRLRRSADISTPLVLGFFQPVVLVPQNFELDLENPGIRAVLEHEIAHLVRGDLWTNLAQHLVLATLWWCAPLYWINTHIGIEREKLCDDVAAQKTGTGRALAHALVDLADKQPKHQPVLAIGIHPRAHNLAERIHRLCKESPMPKISNRLLLTTSLAIPALLGSLVLVAPRAIAHSPTMAQGSSHMKMDDISGLQYGLFHAASNGRLEDVRAILSTGVDPAFHVNGDGSPLIMAAKHGHIEIARLLLQHGAQINRMTGSDESALINAVRGNHYEMVEFLVQNGADISLGQVSNPINRPEWRSPLSTAKKYKHARIAQFLRSQGAVADGRQQTPRRIAPGPIVDGRLTSTFGVSRKKFGGTKHTGIDIANAEGTPILAPADGTITVVTNDYKGQPNWGHVVVLQTPGGIETVFAHLKDSQVSPGQFVRQGTQIARLGNTGKSTGPHVHIQTHKKGKPVDPMTIWPSLKR